MTLGLAALSQQPTFRGGTERILIDVNVVARKDGTPIEGLKADQFDVSIDGRKRPIASIEFAGPASASSAAGTATGSGAAPARDGRIIMLAVDQADRKSVV